MAEQDTMPWYRYFWPWFVIFLLGFAVCSSVYTVFLAMSTAEPVLTESYDNVDE